ncbi:hypothetical protein [Lapillicoccus jejuensis]|nr:hypothetical protein [Lapillicoccus jejuensis]
MSTTTRPATTPAPPPTRVTRRGPSRRLRVLARVVAALGVAVLVAGVAWWRVTAGDDSLGYAALRDQATLQGRQDIVVMNSLDAKGFDASYRAWLDATTGVLHDQLAQLTQQQRSMLVDSGASTTARVVDGALTELDERAGTGRLIAAVELTVVAKDGSRTVKRNRFTADLSLDGSRWKLSQLQQVGVAQ